LRPVDDVTASWLPWTWHGPDAPGIWLSAWLSDTPIYRDALEIVAESPRRQWWRQQLDSGLLAWNLLLTIQGRRRHVPSLWAFALLPHLVSLPFAQNLFYVALLQTHIPVSCSVLETRYV